MSALSAEAEALKASFDTGDRSRWEALMAPGCVNWHNTDNAEVPAQGFGGAGLLHELVEDLSAEIVQDQAFPSGHLIRLVIRGTVTSTGKTLEGHNCVVLTTSAAGITRIDDYVDPGFGDAFTPQDS